MKKLVTLAAASSLVFGPVASSRQQVLRNGSFETATSQEVGDPPVSILVPNQWIQFGLGQQSADVAQHGGFSARATTSGFTGLYQDPPNAVLPGYRVLMKARTWLPSDLVFGPQGVAGMKLEFYPPAGLELPDPVENLAFDPTAPNDTWVQISVSAVVPDEISIAKCVIIMFDANTEEEENGNGIPPGDTPVPNGPIYVDAAYAEVSSNPGVNLLLNPSFQFGNSGPSGMAGPGQGWPSFFDGNTNARKNCLENGPDCPPQMCYVDGNCALKMFGQTTAGVAQQITVTEGDTLTFSAWFRTNTVQPPVPWNDPDVTAGVKIEWAFGNVPPYTSWVDVVPNDNPVSGTTNIVNSASPRDQWLPISIDYTIPAEVAASLRATVINAFGAGSTNNDAYFDSFEMVFTNVFNGSDSDGDDDADMHDIALLQQTVTGDGGGMVFGGLVFDHDEDNDVGPSDVDFTIDRVTGPAVP